MDAQPWSFTARYRVAPLSFVAVGVVIVVAGTLWSGMTSEYRLHAFVECMVMLMSAFTAGAALSIYKRTGEHYLLFIGLALLADWLLEGCHLLTSLEGMTEALLPGGSDYGKTTSVVSKIFQAAVFCWAVHFLPQGEGGFEARTDIPMGRTYWTIIGLMAFAIVAGALLHTFSHHLPPGPIPSPQELIPGALFLFAAIAYLRNGGWRRSILLYYLLYTFCISAGVQLLVLPFSQMAHDSASAASHVALFANHVIILVGVILHGRDSSRERLQDEKQRAESILNIMVDGIVTLSSSNQIRRINPAACKILDISSDQALGMDISTWVPEFDTLLAQNAASTNQKAVHWETDGRRKDGSHFPLEITLNTVTINQYDTRVIILRDITDRRIQEQDRIKLSRQLEAALAAAGLSPWEWNPHTGELHGDLGSADSFGLAMENSSLVMDQLRDLLKSDDLEKIDTFLDRVPDDFTFKDIEFPIINPITDETHWISVSGSLVQGEQKGEERVMGVQRDVTPYKKTLSELTEAREAADEANRVKSAFLANMSHEIRTPMNGVVGMLEVLRQSGLKSKQTEMVEVIKDSAFSLLHLINDILDFSKIEAGKLTIEQAPLDIAALTESVCASLNIMAKEKGVELYLFTDPHLPHTVLGDSLRLRQVMVNLINNAIKFSKNNARAGKVSVRTTLLGQSEHSAHLSISVEDNGIGMSKTAQDAVFDNFVQADDSTSRKFGGTGLGLSISKNLVEMMDGKITLRSVPNEGSLFTILITLPLTSQTESSEDAIADLKGAKCLLIDGRSEHGADIATYLQSAGAKLRRARDVTDGLTWLNKASKTQRVCIIDGGTAHMTPLECSLVERADVRTLVIHRDRRQQACRISDAQTIDGNAMTRAHFLESVAVAAGMIERDRGESISAPDLQKTHPPVASREEALDKHELILVAEDNPTNQLVIIQQLEVLGYRADVAKDGREALEMWQNGDYALLLTDLQMPEMDGYQLATAVRAEENGERHTPIIALSADTLAQEDEKASLAGMDAYLSKPARLEDLQATLDKWLPCNDHSAEPTHHQGNPGLASTVSTAHVNHSELPTLDPKVLEALVGGSEQVANSLLQGFLQTSSDTAKELVSHWESGDWQSMKGAAHKLKSSARSMGAMRLGELCAQIEGLASDNDNADPYAMNQTMDHFQEELNAVQKSILARN